MSEVSAVLITGATGFVGGAVLERLLCDARFMPRAALRKPCVKLEGSVESIVLGEFSRDTDWQEALVHIDCVVHAAGRAHVLNETISDPLEEFRRTNVDGSLALARQAAEAGVKRFIFISSIGVNGNQNIAPFTEDDIPRPQEPYAVSKLEAEEGLRRIAESGCMDVVIIRPPLVYGPGAPGNFKRLIQAVAKGVPLPLGSVNNQRSFVALVNLVDLIITCIEHPSAANQTFLVADGEDLSTVELLRRIAGALGKTALLFPTPVWLLKAAAMLVGKQEIIKSLCGSLRVDISKSRELLGWQPPMSVDRALKITAQAFLQPRG